MIDFTQGCISQTDYNAIMAARLACDLAERKAYEASYKRHHALVARKAANAAAVASAAIDRK